MTARITMFQQLKCRTIIGGIAVRFLFLSHSYRTVDIWRIV